MGLLRVPLKERSLVLCPRFNHTWLLSMRMIPWVPFTLSCEVNWPSGSEITSFGVLVREFFFFFFFFPTLQQGGQVILRPFTWILTCLPGHVLRGWNKGIPQLLNQCNKHLLSIFCANRLLGRAAETEVKTTASSADSEWQHRRCGSSSSKLHTELLYDPAVLLLRVYPRERRARTQTDTCTPTFIAPLSTIAKRWQKRKGPPVNEWIHNVWFIHTMEYYAALKRKFCLKLRHEWTLRKACYVK